ncbi:hypothetical protein CR513_16530, partial [Mucuna pruriens]
MTKSQSNPQHIPLLMNLMMLSNKFSIDKDTLRKDFYSKENKSQREWFFRHFKREKKQQIQDKFYKFVEKVKINIPFFLIEYPWKTDIISDPSTNVITT